MSEEVKQKIQLTIALVLVVGVSFWAGRLSLSAKQNARAEPMKFVGEINPQVPLIKIASIGQGKITGSVEGKEARVMIGETLVTPDEKGVFALETVLAPTGKLELGNALLSADCNFIASKNSKIYHSRASASWKRIKPENRVCFKTEAEAQASGRTKTK